MDEMHDDEQSLPVTKSSFKAVAANSNDVSIEVLTGHDEESGQLINNEGPDDDGGTMYAIVDGECIHHDDVL